MNIVIALFITKLIAITIATFTLILQNSFTHNNHFKKAGHIHKPAFLFNYLECSMSSFLRALVLNY